MDFYSANFTLTWAYAKNLTIILPSGKLSGKLTVNCAYKQLAARIEKPPGRQNLHPPPPHRLYLSNRRSFNHRYAEMSKVVTVDFASQHTNYCQEMKLNPRQHSAFRHPSQHKGEGGDATPFLLGS